jgi:glycogen synthase
MAQAMKILLLGPYPPPQGGIQTHLVGLREYLRQRNIPTYVVNLTRHRGTEREGIYYPQMASQVLRLLLHLPYNLAHIHIGGNLSPRLLGLSCITGVLPGKKVVLTFHSGGYPSSRVGLKTHPRTLRALILRHLDGLIAVNQEIVDFYRKCGIEDAKIRLIPPFRPVEIPEGSALSPTLDQFFHSHHPVILSVGLLEPEYDLGQQIRVIGQLRKNSPHAGLVIIGSGSLEQQLKKLTTAFPEREHILIAGDVPHAETLLAILRSSLLLRTTLYDGDALSIREALQLGTPVIATDNGMRPNGVHLIPPSDPVALNTAIGICLRDGKRHSAIESAGQDNMGAVVEFYEDILAGNVKDAR